MSLRTVTRHGASLALAAFVVLPILTRGGNPPDKPCKSGWEKTWEKDGCDDVEGWKCEDTDEFIQESYTPIAFEQNRGQTAASYQFLTRSGAQGIFLASGGATLDLRGPDGAPVVIRLELEGASAAPAPEAEQPLPTLAHYFIGNDPSRWLTNVPSYGRIRYRDVYPGIDVVYYGTAGELEHDFILRPTADPSRIRMRFQGAESVSLGADGSAEIRAGGQLVTWRAPVLYQGEGSARRKVSGRYALDGSQRLSFQVGSYDRAQPLVIDPVVSYATFIGRSEPEGGSRTAIDAAGNVYVAGLTFDPSFPVTPGARSDNKGAFGDILITKLNPAGNTVLYSTHIGGVNGDAAFGIALDAAGNIYVAGTSTSDDFPTTAGVLKPLITAPGAPSDPSECVLLKLNAAGSALLYSTYLGGSSTDSCYAVAVDSAGSAYVAGGTDSSNFPVTGDRRAVTGRDAFVAKFKPDASALDYSMTFGSTGNERATAMAIDSAGNAYATGCTSSSFGLPITPGALQTTWGGTNVPQRAAGDAFVLKLTGAGAVSYATYLGGSREDCAFGIAVDGQGSAYVAGNTTSTNFRTTAGAFQTEYKGVGGNNIYPGGDGFVAKLNPTGTALVYSTYLGGARDDWATGIAVDSAGNAYVTGATLSTNFPVSTDAQQRTFGGTNPANRISIGDAFLAQLNPAGTALVYSTYLGGSSEDIGIGVAVNASGSVAVAGATRSRNFPVTPGAAQTIFGGVSGTNEPIGDVFVVRFNGSGGGTGSNVVLGGVASAASYAAGAVAPGEIVVLGGTSIGPSALTTLVLNSGNTVSNTLAGTRVFFDNTPAPMIYASGAQSSAVVPYDVAGKTTTQITVEYQGQRSAPLTMPVVAAKPALFSANGSGTGPGAILNEDSSLNSAANASPRGRVIVIYLTGTGQTDPIGTDGLLALTNFPKPRAPITVTIGGRPADVLYAGAAPGLVAGVTQINAKVPEDAATGNPEVIVTAGTARSQSGLTVAVR